MNSTIAIRSLAALGEREVTQLGEVLIDCVEGGASVGFMQPMTLEKAQTFWRRVAATVERGDRRVLVAEAASGRIVGTVQVVLGQPENQPHRADVAKMLVRGEARRQGVGAALLSAAEDIARESGKTLLVLDTATEEAARLYARQGWQQCGEIPDYALLPDGPPCATKLFYKRLGGKG